MTDLGGLPRPVVTIEEASSIAEQQWGLRGPTVELGSQQDRNFRIGEGADAVVLKIANAATDRTALEAQHAALAEAARAGMRVPAVVPSSGGQAIESVTVGGQDLLVRVLTYVDGTPLLEVEGFGVDECRMLGAAAGALVTALAGLPHPGRVRRSQWDLRVATEVLAALDPHVPAALRDDVHEASRAATDSLREVAAHLPEQVIHGDLTDDNAVLDDAGSVGVIDFGDVMLSWRVAELAVTATSVLGKTGDDVSAVLAVVEAFTENAALTDEELTAVWPLVVLRAGVLVASSAEQVALDAGNAYTEARQAEEVAAFMRAAALDLEEMTWLVRACGQPLATPRLPRLLDTPLASLDLSATSPLLDDGAWLETDIEQRLLQPGTVTRYGEYRLTRARPLARRNSTKVLALGVQIALPLGTCLGAAPDGVHVDGVDEHGVSTEPVVTVQVSTLPGRPPAFVTPPAADVWRRLCPTRPRCSGSTSPLPSRTRLACSTDAMPTWRRCRSTTTPLRPRSSAAGASTSSTPARRSTSTPSTTSPPPATPTRR